jgi:hypothetical protein
VKVSNEGVIPIKPERKAELSWRGGISNGWGERIVSGAFDVTLYHETFMGVRVLPAAFILDST